MELLIFQLKRNDTQIAGDIDFANIFSNRLAKKLDYEFDQDGYLASNGKLNEILLDKL